MTAYRFRQCPRCRAIFPGGQLKPVRYGAGHWHERGGLLRRCPECGHVAYTQGFPVVKGRLEVNKAR